MEMRKGKREDSNREGIKLSQIERRLTLEPGVI